MKGYDIFDALSNADDDLVERAAVSMEKASFSRCSLSFFLVLDRITRRWLSFIPWRFDMSLME